MKSHLKKLQKNTAICGVSVVGYNNVTSRITVNVILEKKMLFGLWWSNVDEWNASSTNVTEKFEFIKEVGAGTYRCTFQVTVEGSGGSADVYNNELTATN